MKMKQMIDHRLAVWMTAAVLAAVIGGCGGGGVDVGGTGSPAVSYNVGTVTGFGSVVVDGVAFKSSNASVRAENAPGAAAVAEAKLGHQVELELEKDGEAKAINVEAKAIGPVSAKPDAASFVVLGQTVRANADAGAGPVTVFDGYASIADVLVGDVLEVHGLARRDVAGAPFIQATRIEKRQAQPGFLRVAGVMGELNGQTFKIGGLTVDASSAVIVPANLRLANGLSVVVFGNTFNAATQTLTATHVRIKDRRGSDRVEAYLSGTVSLLDANASMFDVQGVKVSYAGARITPASQNLANGQYVRLRGRFAEDGSFVATRVDIRKPGQGDDTEVELKGTISAWDPATQIATVRDVPVQTAGVALQSCPATGLAVGLFVEIKAAVTATGVQASSVKCDDQAPPGATVEVRGAASAVSGDASAGTLTLTPAAGTPVQVRWSATTFFRAPLTAPPANGQVLKVEGVFDGTTLVATKIKLDN
jgi:hypothetical protein